MTLVAIVHHSGFGHTAAIANSIAEGVREGGAEPRLLALEPGQDFDAALQAVGAADAVVFGSPTYMGDVSAAFKAFAEASAKPWSVQAWKDKLAAGFTVSHSWSGDKLQTLQSLAVLAAQHGMVWIGAGEPPPAVPAAERGPQTVNRAGAFLGLAVQADNAPAEVAIAEGEHRSARLFGARIAQAAERWTRGSGAEVARAA